ncbi:MAG: FkbM family methyltransferase [Methylobacillus sp.]|jgi:FkbM family methyltransferase|nr:FkbM family methyltransferase [Methylobacillus sp.]
MNAREIAADITGLHRLLRFSRLTEIVDIGANAIGSPPPYHRMLDAGLCRITGFEPQPEACAKLQSKNNPHERYLPYAVGDGGQHTLYLYRNTGLVSLFKLDPESLEVFQNIKAVSALNGEESIATRKLDDIEEIEHLDFLKIDIQGGELAVFQNGKRALAQTAVIQTEVTFVPLYKGQPPFGELDCELRAQGFIPHCLAEPMNYGTIAPLVFDNNPWKGLNQLGEADIVYVRDFRKPDDLSNDALRNMALITSACYGSVDLAHRCLMHLTHRGEIDKDACARYLGGQL